MSDEGKVASKKRKRAGSTDNTPEEMGRKLALLEAARSDAKLELEEKKARILSETPPGYNDLFGQMGFTKYTKGYFPCLVLNPFDVPPGPVRNEWLDLFEKLKRQDRIEHLSYVIYWYGVVEPDPCYSFIPRSGFVPFDEGKSVKLKKKCFDLLEKFRGKPIPTKRKGSYDAVYARAVVEVDEDLQKVPHERQRGLIPFQEGWEILSLADVEDCIPVDDLDDSLSFQAEQPRVAKKAMKKRRSSKAGSRASVVDDASDKRSANANVAVPPEEIDLTMIPEQPANVGEIEDIGDADVESDDEKDEDFEADHDVDKEKDEEDEDILEESMQKKAQQPGKERSKVTKKKMTAKFKTEMKKPKIVKAKTERDRLRNCEKKYLDSLIFKWEDALKASDLLALESSFDEIDKNLPEFTAPFIELYLVRPMKASKGLLKSRPESQQCKTLLDKCKALMSKVSADHKEKLKLLPADFKKPKKKNREAQPRFENPAASFPEQAKVRKAPTLTSKQKAHTDGQRHTEERPMDTIPRRTSAASPKREMLSKDEGIPEEKSSARSAPAPKQERKAFSLGRLGSIMHREPGNSHVGAQPQISSQDSLPSWLNELPTGDPPADTDRSLALDFLMEMAAQLPADRVETSAVARSVELAIYQDALNQCRSVDGKGEVEKSAWVDGYWKKVHALVASVCGRRNAGTLVNRIMNGDFTTASQLVGVTGVKLRKSFAEEPML